MLGRKVKLPPKVHTPTTDDEAAQLIKEIEAIHLEKIQFNHAIEEEIAKIRNKAKLENLLYDIAIEFRLSALQSFLEFYYQGQEFHSSHGLMGKRQCQSFPPNTNEAYIIMIIKDMDLAHILIITESVNKEAILQDPQILNALVQRRALPTYEFFVQTANCEEILYF